MMETAILILSFIINGFSGQTICSSIRTIDKSYFLAHKLQPSILDTLELPNKLNNEIKFKSGNKSITLKDDLSDTEYFEYYYAGVDIKRNWLLIKGQNYNQDYYYLYNNTTMTIDTLVGYPEVYGKKIICLEGSETDGSNYIEIWDIINDRIKLNSKYSLNKCNIYPQQIVLSDKNEIMIIDSKNNFWKIKLE